MILLDTCAIIWDALEPKKLSALARDAIETADQQQTLMIADISLWEIAMLINKSRVRIDVAAAEFIQLFLKSRNVRVQPISPTIAELAVGFGSQINADPADRIIAATAISQRAQLVTGDKNLLESKLVTTLC